MIAMVPVLRTTPRRVWPGVMLAVITLLLVLHLTQLVKSAGTGHTTPAPVPTTVDPRMTSEPSATDP